MIRPLTLLGAWVLSASLLASLAGAAPPAGVGGTFGAGSPIDAMVKLSKAHGHADASAAVRAPADHEIFKLMRDIHQLEAGDSSKDGASSRGSDSSSGHSRSTPPIDGRKVPKVVEFGSESPHSAPADE